MARSKYTDEFPLLAEGYARDGLTDEQIAAKFGVTPKTFYNWQDKHRDFAEAVKRGKAPVDTEVENALLKRALGYDYTETHTTIIRTKDGDRTTIKRIDRHVSADVGAAAFWLKNRKRKKWGDAAPPPDDSAAQKALQEKLSKLSIEELRKIAFGSGTETK